MNLESEIGVPLVNLVDAYLGLVDAYLGQRKEFIFSLNRHRSKLTKKEAEQYVWHFIGEAFSKPVTLEDDPQGHLLTQLLAELFKSAELVGIAFHSSVEAQKEATEGNGDTPGFNIVLFNSDDVRQIGLHVTKMTGFDITIDKGRHY